MKKVLGAALAALLFTSAAFADVHYYINANGNDNNTGTVSSAPWASIAKANTDALAPNAANGNVFIHLAARASAWPTLFQPTAVPADGKYFMLIGNPAYPDSHPMVGGDFTKTHTIYSGVRFNGDVSIGKESGGGASVLSNAMGTRLWDCRITGFLRFNKAVGTAVRRTRVDGTSLVISLFRTGIFPSVNHTRRDTISNCWFPNLGVGNASGYAAFQGNSADSMFLQFNRFDIMVPPPAGAECAALALFESRWWWVYGNRFTVETHCGCSRSFDDANCPGGSAQSGGKNSWKIRNHSWGHTWKRDTLLVKGPAYFTWQFGHQGQSGGLLSDTLGSTMKNFVVDSCYFHNPNGTGLYNAAAGWDSVTFTYNVVASLEPALYFEEASPNTFARTNTVNHNTLITTGREGIINTFKLYPRSFTAAPAPKINFTNNIYEAYALPTTQVCNTQTPGGWWVPGVSIKMAREIDTTRSTMNNNLHSLHSHISTAGDRVFGWYAGGNRCCGYDMNAQRLAGFPGKDTSSPYGDAALVASAVVNSYNANGLPALFDPRPKVTSAARGVGTGPSDAGAIAFVSLPALKIETPGYFDFRGATQTEWTARTIRLFSTGNDTLKVDTVRFVPGFGLADTCFAYSGPTELQIPPGQSYDFTVSFKVPLVYTAPPPEIDYPYCYAALLLWIDAPTGVYGIDDNVCIGSVFDATINLPAVPAPLLIADP